MKNLVLLLFVVAVSASAFTVLNEGYEIGDKASDFELMNIDGKMTSLEDYTDAKGFIVTFTCNHCPYAVMYEDRLIALHNKFAPLGYPVVAINPNDPKVQPEDSYVAMKERATEKAFPFAYLLDEGQSVYPMYGATKTPHVFVLDKDLIVRYIGAIDDNPQHDFDVEVRYVANAVEALINGGRPDPEKTRAIGCSIKTL